MNATGAWWADSEAQAMAAVAYATRNGWLPARTLQRLIWHASNGRGVRHVAALLASALVSVGSFGDNGGLAAICPLRLAEREPVSGAERRDSLIESERCEALTTDLAVLSDPQNRYR